MNQLNHPEFTSTSQQEPAPADPAAISPEGLASYTPVQQLQLTRYARVDSLRRSLLPTLEVGDWRVRLIHKARYSLYRDCEEVGVLEEARLYGDRSN
ncbi:MAG: hypothetical protein HYX52_04220 [Chloroflexi bacterium]|nr:hypothetical protein [Chloroflexota bacterium]